MDGTKVVVRRDQAITDGLCPKTSLEKGNPGMRGEIRQNFFLARKECDWDSGCQNASGYEFLAAGESIQSSNAVLVT